MYLNNGYINARIMFRKVENEEFYNYNFKNTGVVVCFYICSYLFCVANK